MYTEILKIIEGGINKDKNKVISYSKVLAENLEKDGEKIFSKKIMDIINKSDVHPVYLDEFLSSPLDQETRMNIVDISIPNAKVELILPKYVEERLDEFILSIKERNKLSNLGIDVTSSLLLYGKPGTGKTSVAHLISYKTNLPLILVRLDSLVSSLLGNTSKNIRKVFQYANNRPCILFLDEFDAIAKARDDQKELGELKRVINSLLQNIDEFNKNNILIAATNHHEMLDPAIWRRFSETIELLPPDGDNILRIVEKFSKNIVYDFKGKNKKEKLLVEALAGLSAADIKTVIENSIKKTILAHEEVLSYNQLIYEIYLFKYHSLKDVKEAVKFLNRHGVQQRSINKLLDIPLGQVGKIIKE
jgi:SpoVK/Ycf46/Vps4 family AAA+-type ATPase